MNLGLQAIQLIIAQMRAEELKDEKWLAEIKETRKRLVDYVQWRTSSQRSDSKRINSPEESVR